MMVKIVCIGKYRWCYHFGKQYITIKLPYGLSANEIWRATIDQNGKQRNSLSVGAKKYKDKVQNNMDLCLEHLS